MLQKNRLGVSGWVCQIRRQRGGTVGLVKLGDDVLMHAQ